MRRREGVTLGQILSQRMDEIERLAKRAEAAPGRKPEAIKARLAEQIAALLDTSDRFDPDRFLPERVAAFVEEFLDRADVVHLSVDLDVLPAAVAPGVSAPAGFGVPLHVVHAVCRQVADSGRAALLDVVELNPRFDADGRTARTAARLITTVVHAASGQAAPESGGG